MLHTEIKDEILFIKLNRPEKRNAISDEIILQLDSIFSSVPQEVKCAIIYGEGKHFSAGLDLSDLVDRNTMQGIQHSRMWHRAMDKIQFGPVPVIAVLHGACIGGGLELASACHIRVEDATTYYALPEGQRGIYVGGGSSVRLPKLIGVHWSPKYFPPSLIQYANTLLKDRMLFGTDFPLITPERWLKDFAEAGFKEEVKPLILKENALRMLKLK